MSKGNAFSQNRRNYKNHTVISKIVITDKNRAIKGPVDSKGLESSASVPAK